MDYQKYMHILFKNDFNFMSVIEGLICPECMKSFISLKLLQDHFQQIHVEQSHITNDSNGFLGVLKKAKKTFEELIDPKENELNIVSTLSGHSLQTRSQLNSPEIEQNISYAFYEEPNIKPQPNGVIMNKTEEFYQMRRSKILISAIEMSSVIIKIEKLVSFQPNGSLKQRKCFEQAIVEWVRDDLVPICPLCGGKFGLHIPLNSLTENRIIMSSHNDEIKIKRQSKLKTAVLNFLDLEISNVGLLIRKKHHCRICGCIICAQCSYMLPLCEANRLVAAVNARFEVRRSLLETSKGLLWNEDSQTSLDSIKSKIKSPAEYSIRCCGNCKSQIEAKWNQLDRRVEDSEFVHLYKDLIGKMNHVSSRLPEYNTMCQSLCLGETEYSYQRTNEIRTDIVKICQEIDTIGNKFKLKIQVNNEREATLAKAIYRGCFLFLQNNFAPLKPLPKEEQLEEIVQKRLVKIRMKADKERTIHKSKSSELLKYVVKHQSTDSGWAPALLNNVRVAEENKSSTNPFDYDESNPAHHVDTQLNALALQMENVRQYIGMARQAKRDEEVKMLQKNMQDLKFEYETLQKQLHI